MISRRAACKSHPPTSPNQSIPPIVKQKRPVRQPCRASLATCHYKTHKSITHRTDITMKTPIQQEQTEITETASRRLCGRQQKATGGNGVAAFLGYPDHSARADCYVLHDARTGARDWEGKGAADILRPDACPASLSEARMAEGRGEEEIDGFFSRSLSRSRRVFSGL